MLTDTENTYSKTLERLKIEFDSRFGKKPKQAHNFEDFKKIKILGEGVFGIVYLVQDTPTGKHFAIKEVRKSLVVESKQVNHSKNEKLILEAIRFPFVVHMECFFKDNDSLYFVMPFVTGGDMFTHLVNNTHFDETRSKFYAAQIILGLEYLHNCNLIYRDLKPENIMLDSRGYLKIADFGFCKKMTKLRTWTICGTPYYIAPELLKMQGYSTSVDWWSFGVLVYEMNAGYPPFYAVNHMRIYEKIIKGKFSCPFHFTCNLCNLLRNVIQVNVTRRLGCMWNGTKDLKEHIWFGSTNWLALLEYKVPAPFVPELRSADDTRYFDEYDEILMERSPECQFGSIFADF